MLAADRGADDPVARFAGSPCKSFVPVAGTPMVLRVLDALTEARNVESLVVCGPDESLLPREPELLRRISAGEISWVPNQKTPSASTYHALNSLSPEAPALVTTSDHALLTPEMVDYFCSEGRAVGADVVVGLVSHDEVMRAYPQTKRTATKFRGCGMCSCNLFAFLTHRARKAAEFWQKCERQRKKPWKMMQEIGWAITLRYLLRRLTLAEALGRFSARMDLEAGAVLLPFPEAAIDVDTVNDLRLVEEIVAARG